MKTTTKKAPICSPFQMVLVAICFFVYIISALAAGELDLAFGNAKAVKPFSGFQDKARAVAIQPPEEISAGFTSSGNLHSISPALAVLQLNDCDYCILQFPSALSATSGHTTAQVFGRIFEAGVTEPAGASSTITSQVGYGPVGTDPRSAPGWIYFNAAFNVQVGNDDEYQATMIAPSEGSYAYVFRFSLDGGANWSYGDLDGAGSNPGLTFDANNLGTMNVSPACPTALTPNSQYFKSGAGSGSINIAAVGERAMV